LLSINFHQTFIPERRYIAALLQYAALGGSGSITDLAEQTGIPMGKSSGKATAMLCYAEGMGLVEQAGSGREISPELTPFGRIVYTEDKFMGEEIVQWLAHMNLCSRHIGAQAWRAVFAEGRNVLGIRFSTDELETYLVGRFGPVGKSRTRTGPLLGTYLEDAALARASVLVKDGHTFVRRKAPLIDNYRFAYSAYLLSLLERHFPGENQVTVTDFSRETLWFDMCLWNQGDVEHLLATIEQTGLIAVDRQMQPWIIEKRADAEQVWPLIFSELS
jgi:hypothetical protein